MIVCVCLCVYVWDRWWSYFLILILKLSLILRPQPFSFMILKDTYSCPVFSVNLQVLQGQWTDVFYAAAFRWYWVGTLNLLKGLTGIFPTMGLLHFFFILLTPVNHQSWLSLHLQSCLPYRKMHFPLDSYLRHCFLPRVPSSLRKWDKSFDW